MRSPRTEKKKLKAMPYRFIEPESESGRPVYERLARLIRLHHDDVADARFALAWHVNFKADVDGRLKLGECRKVSDLDREIVDRYDFVIVINKLWWDDEQVTSQQRDALLDHELCHAAVQYDERGEPVVDERGRVVYRIRKHDIEDFACIAQRYGCWKGDVEEFAAALDRARNRQATWVGYSRLRDSFAAIGVHVPIDTLAMWTDDQRRRADVWLALRADLKSRGLMGPIETPDFIRAVLETYSTHGVVPNTVYAPPDVIVTRDDQILVEDTVALRDKVARALTEPSADDHLGAIEQDKPAAPSDDLGF